MAEVIAVIVVMLMIITVFVPLAYLNNNMMSREEIKQALNLSSKVLVNCIDIDVSTVETINQGFSLEDFSEVNIDKERLLREFYSVMNKNIRDEEKYERVKESVLAKVLVLDDKFYICGKDDIWSPPYFYSYVEGGVLYYFNTSGDKAYFYNGSEKKSVRVDSIFSGGIEEAQKVKNDIIIDRINSVVGRYTYERGVRDGLNIEIRNPYKKNLKGINNSVNVLNGGTTFFVVYGENTGITVDRKNFSYKNYNVVGYTMN